MAKPQNQNELRKKKPVRLCETCPHRAGPRGQCKDCARGAYRPRFDGLSADDAAAGIVGAPRRSLQPTAHKAQRRRPDMGDLTIVVEKE